jgi:CRP-like cAMP-binding protein
VALSSTVAETLSQLALFADLSSGQVEAIAHGFGEQAFGAERRVLRQNLGGSGLFVILEGEAEVRLDGQEVARLGRGEFFGEISALLGEPPVADIVAMHVLRCAIVAGPDLEGFMLAHPTVLYRMLKAEARKLQKATSWRT